MQKLIPLHFVWFVNEPIFTDNKERTPYIDSVLIEKVYINSERILAVQSYSDEQCLIPKITPSLEQEENCGVISCVVDNYGQHLQIEYKENGSFVFFDEDYSYNLNKHILRFSSDNYHRIFDEALGRLEPISFVIYESPEKVIELIKGEHIDTSELKSALITPSLRKMDRIIRPSEARELFGVGKTTFQDWQHPKSKRYRPDFPKKIQLGENSTGYLESDILTYIDKMKRTS